MSEPPDEGAPKSAQARPFQFPNYEVASGEMSHNALVKWIEQNSMPFEPDAA